MNPFRNLSIRSKLILLCLIPTLGLAFYLQKNVREELDRKHAAEELIMQVAQIERMGNVVHHLQVERALSGAYIFVRKEGSRETLIDQREKTDQAIAELNVFLSANNLHPGNMWVLDSLASFRQKTDRLSLKKENSENFMQGRALIILEMTKVLNASQALGNANSIDNHITLLYAKDYLSIIRSQIAEAMVNALFDKDAYGIFYNNDAYRTFASTKGKYDVYMNKLLTVGDPDLVNNIQKSFQGDDVRQTLATIDSVYKDPTFSNDPAAAAMWSRNDNASESVKKFEQWYEISTAALTRLREVEDFSASLIKTRAEKDASLAGRAVTITITVGILITLLVFTIAILTIRGISHSVEAIKTAANMLATGNTSNITIDVRSNDEIGDLAVAFERMISSTNEFSLAAESIGRGDYSQVVAIRSENDTLGKALARMKDDLQKLSHETEKRNWLMSGNSLLNDKLRGEKEVIELAQEVILNISNYLNAQIGAIYLKEDSQLSLIGSYAFQHRKSNTNNIVLGQGLVGQAALEKKMIVFSNVPEDYIQISSGLGHTTPQNIIVFPFSYEGEVKGVIEIGSVNKFTELHFEFLNLIGNSIAIAFNGAQSRSKMQELLEETTRQAEELQSQQEELRQSNEELTEKTSLLEQSESELKSQQEELQQTNEELEEKANLLEEQKETLEETKVDIERKARELEAVSKYKSEFLANMSHELRTPLNSILILSQLLSENKSKLLGEKEMEFAKNIHSSGTDLLNLINEILDLSKVESGKMQLDITDVSFDEINADVNSMFTEVAKTKSINFKITIEKNIGTGMVTDPLRLKQIVRNLLSNAFKFTSKGGHVEFTIAKVSNVTGPDTISFSVKDDGIGIPADKQELVFEAFQQADGSTKRKYGGTGLGLSICRELAIALGGEIKLNSAFGSGSTFTLYLPREAGANKIILPKHNEISKPVTPKPEVNEESSFSLTETIDDQPNIHENDKVVVIMEDDEAFAKVLIDFVRERNYKGVIAHQGNTGLSLARHYKPDAIILDMRLPVMDGTEVLKQLKLDPSLRHIPVQIISGFDLKKEVMALGALGFVKKPISKDDFENAFNKIEDFVSRKIKKVLIVEDNELQNKAIRELIGGGDVKCLSSYSGADAFELLRNEKFDCVIVDLGLPDMSGLELLEKIKNDNTVNTVPVIVYTGKDLSKDDIAKLNRLANTVVLKTADSHERLLDETMLFLHQVESKLPKEKQTIIRKLYKTDEVLKGKVVLVVDDDIRNIYSLTNVLNEEGMTCQVAENGLLAVKALKENAAIDIVLMDVMMPEMDGYEATREIRKQKEFGKLPIIALTAKAMKGDREKCLAAGMSDYVSKPVNISQLLSLMRIWLYKK